MTSETPLDAAYQTVKPVLKDTFTTEAFDGRSCNLHLQPAGREPQLVIFVHGFGGNGYTTWGEFPGMLFSVTSPKRHDVAIFNFDSGIRTVFTRRSKLDNDINRLASTLRELSPKYKSIVIIAHSLGGIVAEAAVKAHLDFLSHRGRAEAPSIDGLFVFASPRAGTGWANPLMGWLIHEFRWLKRFSARTAEIEAFFETHVQSHAVASTAGLPYLIPRFACIGSRDNVVNSFSAGFNIPDDQKKHLHGNHRSIAKPTAADRPQADWVIQRMDEIAAVKRQYSREQRFQSAVSLRPASGGQGVFCGVTTELWQDTDGNPWTRMYTDVLRAANSSGMPVRDIKDKRSRNTAADLLISVHNAGRIVAQVDRDRTRVEAATERQHGDEQLAVGIAAVGPEGGQAATQINNWIDPIRPERQIYVEPANDGEALREIVWRWVDSVTSQRLPHPSRASFRSFADALVDIETPIEDYYGKGAYL